MLTGLYQNTLVDYIGARAEEEYDAPLLKFLLILLKDDAPGASVSPNLDLKELTLSEITFEYEIMKFKQLLIGKISQKL